MQSPYSEYPRTTEAIFVGPPDQDAPNLAAFLEIARLPCPPHHDPRCFEWARTFLLHYHAIHPCVTQLSARWIYVTDLDQFGVPKDMRGWAREWIKRFLETKRTNTPARLLDAGAGVSPSKCPSSRGRTNEILADPRT